MAFKEVSIAVILCLLCGCGGIQIAECSQDIDCETNEQCIEGACQEISTKDFEITLATMKQTYAVGEQAKLTDPPPPIKREYKGYIIEFDGKPLLARLREGQITGMATGSSESSLLSQHRLLKSAIEQAIGKRLSMIDLGEYVNVFNGIALDITDSEANLIQKIPGVKAVHQNVKVQGLLSDSAPLITADYAWNLGYDGTGITIAMIDTGVDYTHPSLGGCLGTGCKVAGGYDFVNKDNDPKDDNGHGTHVAAIAAGNGGGIKGIAPGATIYSYKVLDKYSMGTWANILDAMEMAMDPNGDEDPSDHADILSMSLGSPNGNPDDVPSQAADLCADYGAIVVIAAGNSGPNQQTITSPGTSRKAITVGAACKPSDKGVHCAEAVASFSSRGPVIYNTITLDKPDILAPGASICSAQLPNFAGEGSCGTNLVKMSGTSMATPMVTGAAALLKQAHPDWTPSDIKNALDITATDLGLPKNIQGAGMINISKALTVGILPPVASISTTEISGIADIVGTASGQEFKKYSLYYARGDAPNTWVKLTDSESEVADGILYNNLDASLLSYGTNTLKLEAENNFGQKTGFVAQVTTAAVKSKIQNNQDAPYKGKLFMEVQKYIDGEWASERVMIDGYAVEIPAQGYYALDTLWDMLGGYKARTPGRYRVYAELRSDRGATIATGTTEFSVA